MKKSPLSPSPLRGKKKSSKLSPQALAKQKFHAHPGVEQFYQTLHEYQLTTEAYKQAIQIYIDLKKKS